MGKIIGTIIGTS